MPGQEKTGQKALELNLGLVWPVPSSIYYFCEVSG